MKKSLSILLALALTTGLFTACSKPVQDAPAPEGTSPVKKEITLKIGASPLPHAEILALIKEDLKAEGINLEIIEFTDYVKPNLALNDGEIDANFFQHVPYQDNFNKEHGTNIVSIGTVHVEPLGLYSKKHSSLEALPDGSTIAISSDAVNSGRALLLLQSKGLIKLKANATLESTEKDIVENPKKLVFKSLEAAQLPRVLEDVDAAVINGNYALEAGINPSKDALLLEGAESPYANIISVKKGRENDPEFASLIKVLQQEKVKEFILSKYNGGVVPAF